MPERWTELDITGKFVLYTSFGIDALRPVAVSSRWLRPLRELAMSYGCRVRAHPRIHHWSTESLYLKRRETLVTGNL